MTQTTVNPGHKRILAAPCHHVKAQIVAGGIKLADLSGETSLSLPALSNAVSGRRRNYLTQLAIWEAYRRLTGRRVSLSRFWGELLSKEVA